MESQFERRSAKHAGRVKVWSEYKGGRIMSCSVLLTCDDGLRRRGGCMEVGFDCKVHPPRSSRCSFSNKLQTVQKLQPFDAGSLILLKGAI